ncbi:MAG: hypothetical protein IKP36_09710 [Bacteroidaceae bacterium]|nr:hypothetical protein [Bacteroidaceae bacterium]MBR6142212.1 hypothetical protein [Bacteroidaceae bacterium]
MSKKKKNIQARRADIERLVAIIAQDMGEGLFGRTEAYVERVGQLFTAATDALTKLAANTDLDPATEVFSFSDSKRMSAKSAAILRGLYSAVYNEVKNAIITEWGNANSATDRLIAAALGNDVRDDRRFARLFARNREAVDSFFSRKSEYGGLNLSQKVWKYTGQFKEEMELALSASLGRGDSAATVSRHVRQYLLEPDRLFRRVRDEEGNLQLSKRAAAYHPGRGEYRSSYRNAMRMTRTEVNAAYRAADCDRWSKIDFIIGVEVKRSNHPFACSVCEALAGKYPKDFKFVGWHPQCRCYIVPVLADSEAFIAYSRAILNGEDVEGWKFDSEITEPHGGFKKWMSDNADRVEKAAEKGTLPYWMKDNPQYVKVGNAAPSAAMVKDIGSKVTEIMTPRERSAYVAFEPFSPMVIEKLKEHKDLKHKLGLFEEILSDERAKELSRVESARTVVFPGHKGSQHDTWKGIKQMAKDLNRNGESVAFLPELDRVTSADALVLFRGRPMVADFKYCITTKANTLAGNLEEGFGQAGTVVVKLENMDAGVFRDAIEYLKRKNFPCGNIKLINQYGDPLELTFTDIRNGRYLKKIKGFLK